jgi:hypothetical protein
MARQRRRAIPILTSHFSNRGLEQDDQKDDDQNDNEDASSYVHAEPPFGYGFQALTTTHVYRPEVTLKRLIYQIHSGSVRNMRS